MKDLKPAVFVWTLEDGGGFMLPIAEHLPLCLRQFESGERYRLSAKPERTAKEHAYFMAVVHEAWANFPETFEDAALFPTPDRLRYWCLIQCGFCDEKTIILETEGDAQKMADYFSEAHVNMVARKEGNVVKIWTAHSQNKFDGMDRAEFRKAMDAVFNLLSDMLGVSVTELRKNAGRAA